MADNEQIAFREELIQVIPHLRAFARGLCGRSDFADDLVQETLLKAWAAQDRFRESSSMRAWTFTILRNNFLTEMRRMRFRADYDPVAAERILISPAQQEGAIQLDDMYRALQMLSPERREALLLVGAGGFSYHEASEICGCPIGTMKSRVARARARLAELLDGECGPSRGDSKAASAQDRLLRELAEVSLRPA